jgi:hypothetical protein
MRFRYFSNIISKRSLDHDQKQGLHRVHNKKEVTKRGRDQTRGPQPKRQSLAEKRTPERQHEHTFGTENTVARSNSGFPISEASKYT